MFYGNQQGFYPGYNVGYQGQNYQTYTGYQPVVPQVQTNNTQQITQPSTQSNTLYGKVVDGIDIVRATEVPYNAPGFFPKADLSEIYIKSWLSDGTTQIIEYQRKIPEEVQQEKQLDFNETLEDIYDSINALNEKIDLIGKKQTPTGARRKKEVVADDE